MGCIVNIVNADINITISGNTTGYSSWVLIGDQHAAHEISRAFFVSEKLT